MCLALQGAEATLIRALVALWQSGGTTLINRSPSLPLVSSLLPTSSVDFLPPFFPFKLDPWTLSPVMAAPTPTWGQLNNEAIEIAETHTPHYREQHGLTAQSDDDEKKSPLSSQDGLDAQLPVTGYYDAEKKAVTADDDFVPEDPHSGLQFDLKYFPEETYQLTIRSLVVGTALGCVIAASNVYLGLKTGFTFGASLFGAILGYSILKLMQKVLPEKLGGGFFGPRENCTIQTAATAAGSLTGMYVAAVPAMYQLDLLHDPLKDFGRLITFSAVSAYYGVFFAIPLRKFYILKQKLIFPSPTATAYTVRSLHAPGGELTAKKQSRALLYSFAAAFVFVVVNQYASGILMDWHIFYWLYTWGWKRALVVDNWGWIIEWTPAFLGAGMLSGMNASYSFLGGSFFDVGHDRSGHCGDRSGGGQTHGLEGRPC